MTKHLTTSEQTLLQRYYDGEAAESEVSQVETLLNDSATARVFMAALEEITEATRVAAETAWEGADAPSPEVVARTAAEAAEMSTLPLEDLAPLLERFWDGEVVPEEMAAVSALLQERDDVADYLAALEEVRDSVRASHQVAVEAVSFDGFWDALEGRLDEEDASFDAEQHRVLLYRFHDGEVSESERQRVNGWIAAGEPQVVATLEALSELQLAATVALECAQESVDFAHFWHEVEEGIDDAIEDQGENVVSIQRQKRERRPVFGDYRQAMFGAVAAILCVAFVAGLFKKELFGPTERVIVEKTVVIVDSVEYQPGLSGMVNSPMQPVSATTVEAADGSVAPEEAEPTVIWLIDSEPTEPAEDAVEEGAEGDEPAEDSQPTNQEDEQPI